MIAPIRRGREHERIAARQDDLAQLPVLRDIAEGCLKLAFAEQAAVRPDMLAPEAEAAINRADQQGLEQHAVGIAVHDAGNGGEGVVPDGVRCLMRGRDPLVSDAARIAGR